MLRLLVPRLFQPRHDSKDWSVPNRWGRRVSPMRVWRIKNSLIPMESCLPAAVRLQLRRLMAGNPNYLFRDKVLWIPKLPHTTVRNPAKRGAAWRPPVRYQDGLPNNQHAHLSVLMPS